MAVALSPADEAVLGTVPKMIEFAEEVRAASGSDRG